MSELLTSSSQGTVPGSVSRVIQNTPSENAVNRLGIINSARSPAAFQAFKGNDPLTDWEELRTLTIPGKTVLLFWKTETGDTVHLTNTGGVYSWTNGKIGDFIEDNGRTGNFSLISESVGVSNGKIAIAWRSSSTDPSSHFWLSHSLDHGITWTHTEFSFGSGLLSDPAFETNHSLTYATARVFNGKLVVSFAGRYGSSTGSCGIMILNGQGTWVVHLIESQDSESGLPYNIDVTYREATDELFICLLFRRNYGKYIRLYYFTMPLGGQSVTVTERFTITTNYTYNTAYAHSFQTITFKDHVALVLRSDIRYLKLSDFYALTGDIEIKDFLELPVVNNPGRSLSYQRYGLKYAKTDGSHLWFFTGKSPLVLREIVNQSDVAVGVTCEETERALASSNHVIIDGYVYGKNYDVGNFTLTGRFSKTLPQDKYARTLYADELGINGGVFLQLNI